MKDSIMQSFLFKNLPIRGVFVSINEVWQTIANQKKYPFGVRQLLGELCVANILLTTNIKLEGKIIVQIQNNSNIELIVSECSNDFKVRATAKIGNVQKQQELSYIDCLKDGKLVITIDSNKEGKVYQSIIDLAGNTIASLLNNYMLQSEQLFSVFILAYSENQVTGLLLQQLPDQYKLNIDKVADIFAKVQQLNKKDLLKGGLAKLLGKTFEEQEINLFAPQEVHFSCNCSEARVAQMLRGLGNHEVENIIKEQGQIKINCEFCNTNYVFFIKDVMEIFSNHAIELEPISKQIH